MDEQYKVPSVTIHVAVWEPTKFYKDLLLKAHKEAISFDKAIFSASKRQVDIMLHPYDLTDKMSDLIGVVARFHGGEVTMTREEAELDGESKG